MNQIIVPGQTASTRTGHEPFARLGHCPVEEDNPNMGMEPALFIMRKNRSGAKRMCVLPLSQAHHLCSHGDTVDGEAATAIARDWAQVLYDGNPGKRDTHRLVDLALNWLNDLIRHFPAPLPTKAEFENQLSNVGLKLKIDGETVVDAS